MFFFFVVTFIVLMFLWDLYVDHRQYKMYFVETIPKELHEKVTATKLRDTNFYNKDKYWFSLVSGTVTLLMTLWILFFDMLPWTWRYSKNVALSFGYEHEIFVSLVFAAIYLLFNDILSIPFSLYNTFVLEERHGFNKTTLKLFVKDYFISKALTVGFGVPILSAAIFIVRWGGANFYLYLYGFFVALQLFLLLIYFDYIAPLFNTYTPLEEGELLSEVKTLCKKVNYDLSAVYKVDGSVRSSHSNAYFFGFFKTKRLVLYDTLLVSNGEPNSTDDIMAVVAHEISHWNYSHTLKMMGITLVVSFVYFYLFGVFVFSEALYQEFGFSEFPVFIGMLLFSFVLSPVDHAINLVMNWYSRKCEYEADKGAVELGYDIANALISIYTQNNMMIHVDDLYSLMNNSHPTLMERIHHAYSLRKRSH